MARDFVIPNVGEGVTSVEIASLNVSKGDVVSVGQVVAEVETEKAAADVEIDFAGKVLEVHAKSGDALDVGSVLLTIEESATANESPSADSANDDSAAEDASGSDTEPVETESTPPSSPTKATKATKSDAKSQGEPAATAKTPPATSAFDDLPPAPAGPATRRLARQLGVNLHEVSGSAAGGRITQTDVKSHVRQALQGRASSSGASVSPPPLPDFSKWGPIERQPLNKIARSAAANLSMCWNVIPHVTQHELVDVTELEAVRRRYAETAKKNGTPKITMTAIAMKAVVVCLKEMPKFNSSLDPLTNELVYRKFFHIGCAVDTPNGLLVPVIRDCNEKSISQIAESLSDAASRARDRKLSMDEMQGACFTITNLGGIGGTAFTPIVNYPEVAILGLSRGRKELSIHGGEIEERLMLPLSLSYDHRVINGADAARFVVRFGELLSDGFNLTAHC